LLDAKDRAHVADRAQRAFVQGEAIAEASLITKSGNSIPYCFTARVVEYRGQTCLAGLGVDISERKQREDLLEYAALNDPLTGLGNRTMLSDRLLHSARGAQRKGEQAAIFFLDLDRFKRTNDTLGHGASDELLKAVARRIGGSVRAEDTVARIGGDEFVAVADVSRADDVTVLVGSIMQSFEEPFSIDGQSLHVTTSMGVSVYPADGAEPDQLLRDADTAMYRAKDLGRNGGRRAFASGERPQARLRTR